MMANLCRGLTLKINKGKASLKWSQEARRGSSHTVPLNSTSQTQQIELYLEFATQPGKAYFTTSERERKIFSLPGNKPANERLTTQPMKSHYNSHFTPMNFSFTTAPPNFPLLLCKAVFLSFVLPTCLWLLL